MPRYIPLSNVERQRLFRKRHPGYFGKYRRRMSRKEIERYTAKVVAEYAARAAEPPAAPAPLPPAGPPADCWQPMM